MLLGLKSRIESAAGPAFNKAMHDGEKASIEKYTEIWNLREKAKKDKICRRFAAIKAKKEEKKAEEEKNIQARKVAQAAKEHEKELAKKKNEKEVEQEREQKQEKKRKEFLKEVAKAKKANEVWLQEQVKILEAAQTKKDKNKKKVLKSMKVKVMKAKNQKKVVKSRKVMVMNVKNKKKVFKSMKVKKVMKKK